MINDDFIYTTACSLAMTICSSQRRQR